MRKKLIINLASLEKRIAILENNEIVEFMIQQPNHEEIAGNIYFGRVTDVLPGMNAAFVDIGIEKNGYLHRDQIQSYHFSKNEVGVSNSERISNYIHQGEKMLVQVQKESIGTKGPKLSGLIELQGTNIVYLPFGNYIGVSKKMKIEREKWRALGKKWLKDNEGVVFRTSCEGQDESVIFNELIILRERFKKIIDSTLTLKSPTLVYEENSIIDRLLREIPISDIEEIVIDDNQVFQSLKKYFSDSKEGPILTYYTNKENPFTYFKLEHELEKALKPIVWLDNGAYIIIEHTEAMTVIDVNTGKYAGKTNLKETVFKTNEIAAKEIAKQIRIRDIGGIILIDFIDMTDSHQKKQILHTLRQCFLTDRSRINIIGFTGLGIVEMSREKVRPNLTMMLTKPCPTCSGTGRILSDEEICFKIERELLEYRYGDLEAIWIETNASIIRCFTGENNEHLKWLQESLKFDIYLTQNDKIDTFYLIRHIGSSKEIKNRILNAEIKDDGFIFINQH